MRHSIRIAGWLAAAALACPLAMARDATDPSREAASTAQNAAQQPQNASQQGQTSARDQGARGEIPDPTTPQQMMRHFVHETAQANLAEIAEAKVAEQKAQDPQIKRFAQQLLQDHQQAGEQLTQIARSKQIDVPTSLNEVHSAILANLQRRQGRDFDKHYLYGQVADHVKVSLMLRDAANELQDPQLKQFAQQTLQVVRHHLQEAEQLANAGDAITAGAHLGGSANPENSRTSEHRRTGQQEQTGQPGQTGQQNQSSQQQGQQPRGGQGATGQTSPTGRGAQQ